MSSTRLQFKKLYEVLLQERPRLADVIIWLQGDRYDRALKALKLYQEGRAGKIMISGNNVLIGNKARAGEKNISLDKMKDYLLKKGVKRKDIMIEDRSLNTKEQAENIIKIACAKKWSRLILVGSSYYQPRAFLTFLKQAEKTGWNGKIINQPAASDWNKKPGGRDKTAGYIFEQEFEKIKKYQKDLAPVARGIKYLNENAFGLKKAAKRDARLLFKWVNDPGVKANAQNPKLISWNEHISWLTGKLSDKHVYMYLLAGLKKNIGIIRFEQKGKEFTISYSIDKNYRGQGFGVLILEEGMRKISALASRPIFIAYVKRGNIPSEKIFKKFDFTLKKKKIVNGRIFNIYQKQYE